MFIFVCNPAVTRSGLNRNNRAGRFEKKSFYFNRLKWLRERATAYKATLLSYEFEHKCQSCCLAVHYLIQTGRSE